MSLDDKSFVVLLSQNLLEYEDQDQIHYQQQNWNNQPPKIYEDNFMTSGKKLMTQNLSEISVSKPFKCSYCPHRAVRKDYLQKHERIHTGVRPYQCQYCPYNATQLSTMKRHQQIHFKQN